jgi:hypothetical protein
MSVQYEGNETVELSDEMARRRARVDPEELIGPNCMFWAMITGFVVLGGIMVIWGISNLDKIVQ